MKFRWRSFLVSGVAFILSFSTVNAECEWLLVSCTHPAGTGSNITFNTMEYSRSKYFWNTNECVSDSDIGVFQPPGNPDDGILWRNQSINGFTNTFTDAECISFGMNPDPTLGCPCIEPTYVINYVNGDNRMKESHFASARKCLNGSCNSRDPLGYIPGQPGHESVPVYEHALTGTSAIGEKIRVQIYSHDNATQQFPGDPNYENYMAHNTDVKLSWNDTSHTAQGIVSSSDATPTIKTSPSITLPALPEGTEYQVIGAWHHYNAATSAGIPNYVAKYFTPADDELSINGTTATFNLGGHASCFGNVHRVYFDLEVVESEITENPEFTITKTTTPGVTIPRRPGDTIGYHIAVTNIGNTILPNFIAKDNLNPHLTFLSGDEGVSHSGQMVTLALGNIGKDETKTLNFTVTVNADTPPYSQVCNRATATNSGINHESENVCYNILPIRNPAFSLEKTSSLDENNPLHPGNTFTYSVTATNDGNTVLHNFTATDILNENLSFLQGDNVTATGQTLSLSFGEILLSGSKTVTFTVKVNDNTPTPSQICNQATAINSGVNHSSQNICHDILPLITTNFSIVKSANPGNNSTVTLGDTITYTLHATNTGNTTLNSLVLTDILNQNVQYEGSTNSNISYDASTHTITGTFPSVSPGSSITAQFHVVVKNTAATNIGFCNEAFGTANEITKTSNSICHHIVNKEISLTKTADIPANTPVDPGQILTYTISATNNTVAPLNILVTDPLEPLLQFIESSNPNLTYDVETHTISIAFNNVPAFDTVSTSFQAQVLDPGEPDQEVCNEVSLVSITPSGGSGAGTDGGNNTALNTQTLFQHLVANTLGDQEKPTAWIPERICHPINTGNTAFTLVKNSTPAPTTTLTPGDTLTYTITATNTGTTTLDPLVITDVLNPNVEFPTQLTNLLYDASTHTITGTFPSVSPGSSITAQFHVVVKNTAATNIGFCNEAFGTANEITKTSNSICHHIVNKEISLTKTADIPANTPVDPGQILTYTISATNNTVAPLNILVTDPLEPLLQFIESSNPNLTYDVETHTISIAFNNVPAFDTVSTSFQAQVLDPGEPDQEVCNEVSLVSINSNNKKQNTFWKEITKTINSFFSPVKNILKSLTSSLFDIRTLELLTANSLNENNQGGEISAFTPERICHPITQPEGGTLLLEKTSNPTPDSTVNTGDTVLYKIRLTNNSGSVLTNTILDPLDPGLSFIAPGTISSSDTNATGTITFDNTPSLISLNVNNLGNEEWMMFEFSTEVSTQENVQVCNQANITAPFGQIYHSENVCLTVDNEGTGGETFLEKFVSPTGTIANGDTLTYTVRMTSDETTAFSTLINDTLDNHLVYIGNEITTTSNTGITGNITHDGSATGGLIRLTVNNLSSGWIEFSFDVLVEGASASTQICNQANEIDGNWFSNIVCSSTESGNGGGGQTISTIGICTDLVNGSVTCRKHTPHPSFGEEAYQIWKECKKNANEETLKICTHDWAATVGLLTIGECHPDNIISNQTIGRWNPYNGYYVWNGGLSDENNECNTPLPEPCTPCNEIAATITKTTTTPAVAKEENAKYTTILSLDKTEPKGADIKITGIKVYDLTIPAESGWIYEHYMNGTSEWEWKGTQDDPASNYFEFTGGSFDISNNETFIIPYEMDTALTIKADTAQVKNVAFAIIEYQIQQEEGTWSNPASFYVGNTDIEKCRNRTVLDIINKASTSTEGAITTVKIVRPFVEVRGGGNVGVQKLDDTTENPFGGLQTGGEFENTLSTGEILTDKETENIIETENLWDTYEGQTSVIKKLFGINWQTTPDDSGVYFTENNVTLTTENALDLTGNAKTFVITGTLSIQSNFEPTVFGAFIADQIIINETVTKMTGVFIADTGNIISPEISYKQLVVSGSLMGDATNLLSQRKFIGLHPEETLEPSIKINYDLRLLDATPPALELFLSEDWTQSAEE